MFSREIQMMNNEPKRMNNGSILDLHLTKQECMTDKSTHTGLTRGLASVRASVCVCVLVVMRIVKDC